MLCRIRTVLVIANTVATAACGQAVGPVCTLEARPALTVEVRDSVTNAPAEIGTRIIARTGLFADTVDVLDDFPGPFALALEQPGEYLLTVEHEEYQPWSQDGIQVTEDECHVQTVHVVARLQR